MLHSIDWIIIAVYLLATLVVGMLVKESAGKGSESFFLADRSLPWWLAGTSIAATTFSADTPLAIAGIIANKGIAGNWMWFAVMLSHAAVIFFFAKNWRKSRVVTDAELLTLRYSGRSAKVLKILRVIIYGGVYNGIVLGWVMKAMVKVVQPFFHWKLWFPSFMSWFEMLWPKESSLGSAENGLTIILLVLLVGIYSSMGGIKAVIYTDFFQFAIALFGSFWLSVSAWNAVGGQKGIVQGLSKWYGNANQYIEIFPVGDSLYLGSIGMSFGMLGLYLFIQSFSSMAADGGGYLMQRLGTTKTAKEAQLSALLFFFFHYLFRVWPWFICGIAALILIPKGNETILLGNVANLAVNDREITYSILMSSLLGPGILGIMMVSMMAAFMSTIDTHLNWGASYIVNDVFNKLYPNATQKNQVIVARLSVLFFMFIGVFSSFQIQSIEQAWKWVAAIGASLGLPVMLRWIWWRVNAFSEILSMFFGIIATMILSNLSDMGYEKRLIFVSMSSAIGMLIGIFIGPKTDSDTLKRFYELVKPIGVWPYQALKTGIQQLLNKGILFISFLFSVILIMFGIHRSLFYARYLIGFSACLIGMIIIIFIMKTENVSDAD